MSGSPCQQPRGVLCRFLTAGLFGMLWVLSPMAHAEKADRQAPTHIDSDKLDHDDKTKRTIFTGNVVLTKGSREPNTDCKSHLIVVNTATKATILSDQIFNTSLQ